MSNKHPASGGKLSQIWLDKAAFHYDAHVHLGLSIRALARKSAGHASTILRQIRRIEALQSDPQVKAALAQLKSTRGEGADPATSCQPGQSLNKDVMHLLEPKNAVLVMSENVEMAGIFLISSEYAPQKLGLVPRARAQVAAQEANQVFGLPPDGARHAHVQAVQVLPARRGALAGRAVGGQVRRRHGAQLAVAPPAARLAPPSL